MIAYVGSAGNNVGASTTITTNYTSSGGMLFAMLSGVSTLVNPDTQITDSAGNAWMIANPVIGLQTLAIYCTQSCNPAPVTSVTISGVVSGNLELMILEYSGVLDVRPYSGVNTAATSTTPSISVTLNAADNWILAGYSHVANSTGVYTPNVGNLRIQQASSTTRRVAAADNTAGSITSVTVSTTIVIEPWNACAVELVAAVTLNIVHLTALSTGGTNTFLTSPIAAASGDLILVGVKITSVTPSTTKLGPPSLSGCGLTFRFLTTSPTAGTRQIYMYYAIGDANAFNGAIQIQLSNNIGNDITFTVERVRGYDTSSSIAWLVQARASSVNLTSIHIPSLVLPPLQDANSLVYGFSYTSLSAAQWGPGAGWFQLAELSATLSSQWKLGDNVVVWTNTGASTVDAIIALELTATNLGLVQNPLAKHSQMLRGEGK